MPCVTKNIIIFYLCSHVVTKFMKCQLKNGFAKVCPWECYTEFNEYPLIHQLTMVSGKDFLTNP